MASPRATASDLQHMLETGTTTSIELVERYCAQIEAYNQGLRAIISVAPKGLLRQQASALDAERAAKGSRGPFHGIPVILKDAFNTPTCDMDTTCGSTALRGQTAIDDANVVKKILQAGMIILAKANMSVGAEYPAMYCLYDFADVDLQEWGGFQGYQTTAGWSAAGGQTQSPYVHGGVLADDTFLGHSTPSGSSSGSAVAVAAGFAPISFGLESIGSVVQPAGRAALYALRVTQGTVDLSGTQPGNPDFDGIGAFAKSPLDLANVMSVIFATDSEVLSKEDFPCSWQELRVGFVDPTLWQPPEFETKPNEQFMTESIQETNTAIARIAAAGAHIVENVVLHSCPPGFDQIFGARFKNALETYLSLFKDAPVQTLNDLIQFNEDHAEEELPPEHPSQAQLEDFAKSAMSKDKYQKILKEVRAQARDGIVHALQEYQVDVIIAPADSGLACLASAAGYPAAAMPLGFAKFNGRAHGLNLVARSGDEWTLLRVMSAWEAAFPNARRPPSTMGS